MASATGGAERIEVNTSVGVRGENGMFFGNMRWLEPRRLLVEIAAEFSPRESVDVRINLMPTPATALFVGRVDRALVTATGEVPRYLIEILSMKQEERERLDAWTENVRGRGTFSNFDVISTSAPVSQQSSSDVQRALARLAQRPLSDSPPTDPFGVRSDIVTNTAGSGGRTSVRDALKEALQRRAAPGAPGRLVAGVEAKPQVARPDSAPGRVVAATSVPPRSDAAPAPAPRSGAGRSDAVFPPSDAGKAPAASIARPAPPPADTGDPSYATSVARGETWMEVRWRSATIFERDARLQICNYMLVLSKGATPLPDGPVRVMLRHADFALDCGARLRAAGAHGATWQLDLDALQIERVRQWLKTYGKK